MKFHYVHAPIDCCSFLALLLAGISLAEYNTSACRRNLIKKFDSVDNSLVRAMVISTPHELFAEYDPFVEVFQPASASLCP